MVAAISRAAFAGASEPDVMVLLYPLTGEVRMVNYGATDFAFTFYSLKSLTKASLNGSAGIWKSISSTYDFSGNGLIDATDEWTNLTPSAMAGATELSESVFSGPGGVLPANRAISLGKIWSPSLAPDVTARIGVPDAIEFSINVDVSVDGDYFANKLVGLEDYAYWKASFGKTNSHEVDGSVFADGNLDGIVNAADYTIWRNNLGLSVSGSGSGEAGLASLGLAATAVPEPAGIILGLLACVGCLSRRCWFRRRR
jgi:hypothetical protein